MLPDLAVAVKPGAAGRVVHPGPGYVACGRHAALAFLEARPGAVARLLLAAEARDDMAKRAAAVGVAVERCPPGLLDRFAAGVAHQGIVALGEPPPELPLTTIEPTPRTLLIALDSLTDPRNVGAILRTAEAAGALAVLLARDRAPRLSPALVKAAAGAVERLPVVRVTNLARALVGLRASGFWVIGLDPGAECDLFDPDVLPGLPCVLVLGAEGEGIRPLVRRACHRLLRIPMAGRVQSLNASVAAGVALFEIRRAAQVADRSQTRGPRS